MYKFIVSCYYWPSTEGRLRLRGLEIKSDQKKLHTGLDAIQVVRHPRMANGVSARERRQAPRLKAGCDAELTTSLSILDTEVQSQDQSLVFLGRTTDMSAGGLAFVLPSTLIDERYCGDGARLQLSLHLPTGRVNLEVSAVRCVPLRSYDTAMGYLVGAQILSLDDEREEYDDYLRSISGLTLDS